MKINYEMCFRGPLYKFQKYFKESQGFEEFEGSYIIVSRMFQEYVFVDYFRRVKRIFQR